MVSKTSESRNVVSYLDLLIDMSNGDPVCSIFDKTDAFDFDIVNFPRLIWEHSNSPCLWYIHLTADKIQSGLP